MLTPTYPLTVSLALAGASAPVPLVSSQFEAGLSVWQALQRFAGQPLPAVKDLRHINITCASHALDPELWHRIYPKAGLQVIIRPQGDNAGAIAGAAVAITASLIAPGIGMAIGGALGLSTLGTTAVTAAVGLGLSFAGAQAVSALFPPPTPPTAALGRTRPAMAAQAPSVSMARNGMDLWGVVPRVYGKRRLWPPYAAAPFVETDEDKGVAYGLYCLGPGRFQVSDIKIGDVDAADFPGLEYRVVPPGGELELWPGQVDQDQPQVRLLQGSAYTAVLAPCQRVVVNILFEEGLYEQTDQGAKNAAVAVTARIRPQGSTGAWRVLKGGDDYVVTDPLQSVAISDEGPHRIEAVVNLSGLNSRFDMVWTCPTSWGGQTVSMMRVRVWLDGQVVGERNVSAGQDYRLPLTSRRDTAKIVIKRVRYQASDDIPDSTAAVPAPVFKGYQPGGAASVLQNDGLLGGAYQAALQTVVPWAWRDSPLVLQVIRDTPESNDERLKNATTIAAVTRYNPGSPLSATATARDSLLELRLTVGPGARGAIERVNCVLHSILQTTQNGLTFSEQASSNPAWILLDILCGNANPKPSPYSEIDWPTWLELAAYCDQQEPRDILEAIRGDAEPKRQVNMICDYGTSVQALVAEIASYADAAVQRRGGKWVVVRDDPSRPAMGLITPLQTRFVGASYGIPKLPHALRVGYVEPEAGYQQEEVIAYADGFDQDTATDFEDLAYAMLTSKDAAWRKARRALKAMALRRQTVELVMDWSAVSFAEGDLVKWAEPRFQQAQGVARLDTLVISGGLITAVTLSEPAMHSGAVDRLYVWRDVQVVTAYAGSLQDQRFVLDTPLQQGRLTSGLVAAFGAADTDIVKDMVVRKIAYQGDLTFRVTITDAALAILDDESATTPAYSSLPAWIPRTAPPPVQNLTAKAAPNQRGYGTDVDVTLTWARGIGPVKADSFRVFENGQLVAETQGDAPLSVSLASRAAAKTFIYRVVGVSATGNVIPIEAQPTVQLFTPNFAFQAIEILLTLPDPATWTGGTLVYSIATEKYYTLTTNAAGDKVWLEQGGGLQEVSELPDPATWDGPKLVYNAADGKFYSLSTVGGVAVWQEQIAGNVTADDIAVDELSEITPHAGVLNAGKWEVIKPSGDIWSLSAETQTIYLSEA